MTEPRYPVVAIYFVFVASILRILFPVDVWCMIVVPYDVRIVTIHFPFEPYDNVAVLD